MSILLGIVVCFHSEEAQFASPEASEDEVLRLA
jgi:hypothetical protein